MRPGIFIAVTHLLGAGHLTRAAAIGRAFAAAGHRVTLASGGMPSRLIALDGIDLVQLPPVRALDEDFRALCEPAGRPVDAAYMAGRRDVLLAALATAQPEVVITELYPFGRRILAPEFDALLAAAATARPKPIIACSLRDILVAPVKPGRIEAAHRILAEHYDAVLVHGDPALVPLDASWPVDAGLRARLIYTGYVDPDPAPRPAPKGDGPILVAGGSSAAALPLYRTAIGAAASMPDRPWHLLVGAGVVPEDLASLRRAAPPHMRIEPARPDFRQLLAEAHLFVGLAGYNTVVDLLAAGTRAVLVPFERGRETEQRLRADRLASADLATLLPEAELNPEALAGAVREGLALARPARAAFDRNGTANTVRILADLVQARHGLDMGLDHHPSAAPAILHPALSPSFRAVIRHTLDSLADRGETRPFWWRDDDATTPSPALERLLALAEQLATPLALAAIPAAATDALAGRIADAPDLSILVHGLRHENHAPTGSKKAEFGSHRPLAALADEARHALALAQSRFGDRALPVFVPPWNRIAPELVATLPALSYGAVSTFGPGRADVPRLRVVNTHLDPVDWHRGGGLVPEAAALAMWRLWAEAPYSGEPLGLLTHHLVMDEASWAFCEALVGELASHPAIRIQNIAKLALNASTVEALTNPDIPGLTR
jgi:predicted glycosyltransferase